MQDGKIQDSKVTNSNQTYNDEVFITIVKMPKEDSAFFYFQLEANEGLCFYSTLEHQTGDQFREIEIKCHISMKDECLRLIDHITQTLKKERENK